MIKKILALICAAAIIIPAAGCAGEDGSEFPITVGHTRIENAVNDAVVLSDNAADIILEMGYESRIDGRSDECTQEKISKVDSVGSKDNPSIDKIAEISPQVVIADSTLSKEAIDSLAENKIPVLCFVSPSTTDELKLMYEKLGMLFGGKKTGTELGDKSFKSLSNALEKNAKALPDVSRPKTVCYLFDYKGKTVTGDMLGNIIFKNSGAENVASSMAGGQANIKEIIKADPQYIFCDTGMKNMIKKNADFKKLLAVKNNRVVEIPAESFTRGGVSVLGAMKTVTDTLYPNGKAGSVAENYGIKYNKDIYLTVGNGADTEGGDEDGFRDTIIIIQTRLDDLGYWPLNETTGYYGDTTAVAVADFQSANGFDYASGEIDKKTLDKMFSDNAVARSKPVEKQSADESSGDDFVEDEYYE